MDVYLIGSQFVAKNHDAALATAVHSAFPDASVHAVGIESAPSFAPATDAVALTGLQQADVAGAAQALAAYLKTQPAGLVALADDAYTTQIATRLAAALNAPIVTHVTGVEDGKLIKKGFSGNLLQAYAVPETGVATFDLTGVAPAEAADLTPQTQAVSSTTDAVYTALEAAAEGDLSDADVVIAGGRGLQDEDGVALLEKVAQKLHAGVAASRAAVDAGWFAASAMVGQSGKTITPKLYVAVGISGTVQHTVGMDHSAKIVAINSDADAPIFKLADVGIVGDAKEVLQQLLEQLG